jgi:hypothetical protein
LRKNRCIEHVIEGKLERRIVNTRRECKRRKRLLGDVKEEKECWKLKEEVLDRTWWRTRSRSGYDTFEGQARGWINE